MSQQLPPPATEKRQVQARFSSLRVSRQSGVFGVAEIIGLAGALLILVLVIVSYLYFLVPARSRRAALELERARLQSLLRNSQDSLTRGLSIDATVHNITQSLDAFETAGLVDANRGRMGLYDSLNSLIRKNGLRNTSGPSYTPLEPTGSKTSPGSKAANTKWQSIYPGIAISVTVEGPYQNLRRFVRDIETSKQFIVINTVELERATESSGASETGSSGNSLVSLRLEMTTYFQRVGAENISGD
ncbi:MAG TPA: GspMb/PilO family protein [Pyrinomonadaceae bacterium]|jgi:Tfp pilus assembly protein PilO|nr:GspMb/PilO family protein [Pyrinomonadaceae bacterium]